MRKIVFSAACLLAVFAIGACNQTLDTTGSGISKITENEPGVSIDITKTASEQHFSDTVTITEADIAEAKAIWAALDSTTEMAMEVFVAMSSSGVEDPPDYYLMEPKTYPQKVWVKKNADGKTMRMLSGEADFTAMMPVKSIAWFPKVELVKTSEGTISLRAVAPGTSYYPDRYIQKDSPKENFEKYFTEKFFEEEDAATARMHIKEYSVIQGHAAAIKSIRSAIKMKDGNIVMKICCSWNLDKKIEYSPEGKKYAGFAYMFKRVQSYAATKGSYAYGKLANRVTGIFTLIEK